MRVEIYEDYFVDIDEYNHTLKRKVPERVSKADPSKMTKARDEVIGYFPNMQQSIRKVIFREAMLLPDTVDLQQYITKLEEIEDGISQQYEGKAGSK